MELIDLNMNLKKPVEIKFHCPVCQESSFGYYESWTPLASSSERFDWAWSIIIESTNQRDRYWNLKLAGAI